MSASQLVEQILDPAVMRPFFVAHLNEVVPGAARLIDFSVALVRRFDGATFYDQATLTHIVRARYTLTVAHADGKHEEVILYGKAMSDSLTPVSEQNEITQFFATLFPGPPLQAVRPIGFYPEVNLLLRHGAPGETVRTVLEDGCKTRRADIRAAVTHAASFLARAHAVTDLPPVFPTKDNLARLESFRQKIDSLQPADRRGRFTEQYGNLLRQARELAPTMPLRLVHGDFHAENIFWNNAGIVVIDFDDAGRGDPAQDVGSFLVQTRAMAFPPCGIAATTDILRTFAERYAQAVQPPADFWPRVNFWQARTLVKNLAHHLLHHRDDETRHQESLHAADYLDEISALLAATAAGSADLRLEALPPAPPHRH